MNNGNVTNDGINSYAWDTNGRPTTINSVGVTYDALGNMVEQNRSGAYTQIVYAPDGAKLGLMSGTSTLQKGFVPLTGGATGAQTFSRSYTYDGLNRLATMAAPGDTCTGLSWTYDAWGNRTDQNYTGGTCGTFHATVGTNNRFTTSGYTYDAAGNMTSDGSHTYFYDAENHLIQVGGTLGSCSTATACYIYDAGGSRVEKTVGGTARDFLYGTGSNVLAEVTSSGWQAGYVYFNDQLLAEYQYGTTYFAHHDHLGSTRLLTNISGGVYDSYDYLPFGESIGGGGGTSHKFTGKERDSESNLDNFLARYDSSAMGRFMSPDPLGGSLMDPQSLNKYSYVRNNPLNLTDPTGMSICDTLGSEDCLIAKAQCNGFFFGNCSRFGDSRCTIDGITSSCDIAFGAIGSGAAVQCPNNQCEIGIQRYMADAGGTEGYFYTSAKSAAAAAFGYVFANRANAGTGKVRQEYGGLIFSIGPGYSYTSPLPGDNTCTIDTVCGFIVNLAILPDDATLEGLYHSHPFGGPLLDNEDANTAAQAGVPTYIGSPSGCVASYDPNAPASTMFNHFGPCTP